MIDDRPEIEKELHRLGIKAERNGAPEAEIKRIKFLIWCQEARENPALYLETLAAYDRDKVDPEALVVELIAREFLRKRKPELERKSPLDCRNEDCGGCCPDCQPEKFGREPGRLYHPDLSQPEKP